MNLPEAVHQVQVESGAVSELHALVEMRFEVLGLPDVKVRQTACERPGSGAQEQSRHALGLGVEVSDRAERSHDVCGQRVE